MKSSLCGSLRVAVAAQVRACPPVGKASPEALRLFIKGHSDSRGTAADSVVGNLHASGMPDDTPWIKRGKFGRDSANEVPGSLPAGEKIGHRGYALLDEMLDTFRLRRSAKTLYSLATSCLAAQLPQGGGAGDAANLERAKGFEPSTPTLARSCSTPELHPRPGTG